MPLLSRIIERDLVRRIEQLVGRSEGRLPYIYALDKKGGPVRGADRGGSNGH